MTKRLLIAVAALASSVLTSPAGSGYSNIVGYNTVTTQNGQNTLMTCPFNVGASNGINELFGSSLPASTEILIWDQVAGSFDIAIYDNTQGNGTNWYEGDDTTPLSPLPCLVPGRGFFIANPPATITNIFAGAVTLSVGSSNHMVFKDGYVYYAGCPVPYAGLITNGTVSTGGPDLNGLAAHSTLKFYNSSTSSYLTAIYDNTKGLGTPNWYQSDDSTPFLDPATGGNVPSIAVGQGFYISVSNTHDYLWWVGL